MTRADLEVLRAAALRAGLRAEFLAISKELGEELIVWCVEGRHAERRTIGALVRGCEDLEGRHRALEILEEALESESQENWWHRYTGATSHIAIRVKG